MSNLLTPRQVAEILRVKYYTVMNMIAVGDLPAYQVGRFYRIKPADLEEYLESRPVEVVG